MSHEVSIYYMKIANTPFSPQSLEIKFKFKNVHYGKSEKIATANNYLTHLDGSLKFGKIKNFTILHKSHRYQAQHSDFKMPL